MWEELSRLLGVVAAAIAVIDGSVWAVELLIKRWNQLNGLRLAIESVGENSVLDVTEKHTIYGFSVRNVGRKLTQNVRAQLVKVEGRGPSGEYRTLLDQTFDLEPVGIEGDSSTSVALVPGRTIKFRMASSKHDSGYGPYYGVVYPSVLGLSERFEEFASDVGDFRYTVAAIADGERFASKALCVRYQ